MKFLCLPGAYGSAKVCIFWARRQQILTSSNRTSRCSWAPLPQNARRPVWSTLHGPRAPCQRSLRPALKTTSDPARYSASSSSMAWRASRTSSRRSAISRRAFRPRTRCVAFSATRARGTTRSICASASTTCST
ncbi:hypothetical protein MPH_05310 [Macrophomina phaseolina MS6]|uniref:Uncharacterized protein n=1 Tax=Macrophomina phaseolina (strain MS6) TaxID=1126212 RepID=K2R4Z0_MACPH|nr:hypothetical protein MPH_05310 [Macrophomina phaseolina MS6]